ncbi:MAG: DUF885 domain-containing protein [Gammaproteobacteria bacterium]|nr:DUF885 domain-containing protein [Gammaproteobacteria bacterium]
MKHNTLIIIVFSLIFSACAKETPESATEQVNRIAAEFLDGYYAQYPEEAYESAYPNAPSNRFGDHSAKSIIVWDQKVEQWLQQMVGIDPRALNGTPEATTYLFTLDRLQAIVDRRICRSELWNISPTWTGWQTTVNETLAVQPVQTPQQRTAALARLADLPRLVDTEISNLRQGVETGYLAPTSNVAAVAGQMRSLLEMPSDDSPLFSPALRSSDKEFVDNYRGLLETDVKAALTRYRDYLIGEYQGREQIGVRENPEGATCYAASVRYWSSLPMDPADIHRAGLTNMSRIQSEMLAVAKESFGTDDVGALLQDLKTNPLYTFSSEQEMLDHVNAAVRRGEAAVHEWFGNVPDAEIAVIPYPAYEKNSGGGFYSAGSADGQRPGTYKVGTYNPRGVSKAGQESTAFHESWPGHHLQGTVALRNESLHPILRYMWVSGSAEGWALYTEKLADEMGLYSSAVTRMGMLSDEAHRAARLVVDTGMHVMGWTRQQAIDYLLENTALGVDNVNYEIDRYAAVPGQATSYLLGSLEIQRLRTRAERELGDDFDIRVFHDRILENGAVTLPMLGMSIETWIDETIAE